MQGRLRLAANGRGLDCCVFDRRLLAKVTIVRYPVLSRVTDNGTVGLLHLQHCQAKPHFRDFCKELVAEVFDAGWTFENV